MAILSNKPHAFTLAIAELPALAFRRRGVLWGFRPREELVESGAQTLAARPEDLLSYF